MVRKRAQEKLDEASYFRGIFKSNSLSFALGILFPDNLIKIHKSKVYSNRIWMDEWIGGKKNSNNQKMVDQRQDIQVSQLVRKVSCHKSYKT